MMNKMIITIGIICLVVACNYNRSKSIEHESHMNDTVVFEGCKDEINISVGTVALIKLEAIQGTGYQWVLKAPTPLLEQLDADVLSYASISEKENMPGKYSFQILSFKAVKAGTGKIQLDYKRTFETTVDKTCTINVVVK